MMMPAYRSMDSHSYQRNQIPLPRYYHPDFDIPPQTNVDPSISTLGYEQRWPYASSYGPTPVHSCCGHNNYPGYCRYRPAYPHIPTSPPMYYPGGYPAQAEPFSIPYAPPQQYTMDLPRYEYDKCMPREYHCCGCPNNPFHQNEGKGVKFEEHEPDTEKKVNDGSVPIQLVNYPYPFVWIPPEYMNNNKEQKKPIVAEMDEQDKVSHDAKHPRCFTSEGQEPRSWNGWFPFYTKTLPKMILDGDGRRNQHQQDDKNRRQTEDKITDQNQQSEDKRMEFPFPIVWVPYYNKQEKGGRSNNHESIPTPKTSEEVPCTSKFVPVNICETDADRTGSNRDEPINTSGSDVTVKVSNKKNIPVKQMDMHQKEDDSKGDSNRRERNIPVKQLEEKTTDKIDVKRQSVSPKKGAKLPPVCLRVDPLPKKKNGNGSSRSPSPPASKEHSQATAGGTAKVTASSSMSDAQPDSKLHHAWNTNDKVKQKENVEVSMKTSESKDDYQRDKSRSQTTCDMPSGAHENNSGTTMRKESWCNGDTFTTQEMKEERKEEPVIKEEENEAREARDSTRDDDKSQKRKVLSDVEAAVLIQAAYRGFQVRKWELLKKLKQIAEVSKQVADVRDQVQALEASSGLQNDDKQRVAIGETIMRLLLKLDTVQGLHPSFREIRKTLARELISMQEKLDSVTAEKSHQQIQELSEMRPIKDIHPSTLSINSVQEHGAAPGKDSSEGSNTEGYDIQDPCQDQYSMKDSISGLKTENRGFAAHNLSDDDKRESRSEISPVSNEEIKPNSALNDTVNEDAGQATNDVCNCESPFYDTDQAVMENGTKSEDKCVSTMVDDLDIHAFKELLQGIIEEEPVHFDSGKEVQTDMEMPQQSEVATKMADNNSLVMAGDLVPDEKFPEIETMSELPMGILDDSAEDGKHSAIEALAELPVGGLDMDTTTAQFDKSQDITYFQLETSDVNEPPTQEFLQAVGEGLAAGISTETQTEEQQQREKQTEVQSSEESDGWVKVESRKDGKLNEDTSLDIEVKSGQNVDSGNEQFSVIPESQSVPSLSGTPMEANDFYGIQSQPTDCRMDPEMDAPMKDVGMDKALVEEVTLQDQQLESGNMVDEYALDANAGASPKEKDKVILPVSEERHLAEQNKGLDGDTQLTEENKKLREMMNKLLEAGNQQLHVISDLTGRVKDLEKKLARKRRLRTKRYRPATSCMKSSNDLTQAKSVDVMI